MTDGATTAGTDGQVDARRTRRRLLATTSAGILAGLAGCTGVLESGRPDIPETPPWLSEGPEDRPEPAGTSMADLPAISGDLTVYSGREEEVVGELLEYIDASNPEFELEVLYGPALNLVNKVLEEGENTRADVVHSYNVPGTLGALSSTGRTRTLPDEVLSMVAPRYRDSDGQWVASSGRLRVVPFYTTELTAEDLPDDIMAFPELDSLAGALGWTPRKGSFHGFVTAMRVLEGDDPTRDWLEGMQALDPTAVPEGFEVVRGVADGEFAAGFTNHYYAERLRVSRPAAPIGVAHTSGDAGAVLNGAGAGVIDSGADPETANLFVRYLLSTEAMEYYALGNRYEYPASPSVGPLDRLPSLSALDRPDVRLDELTDLPGTLDMLRDVGLL